jgi:hypothetical protein
MCIDFPGTVMSVGIIIRSPGIAELIFICWARNSYHDIAVTTLTSPTAAVSAWRNVATTAMISVCNANPILSGFSWRGGNERGTKPPPALYGHEGMNER